MLLHIVSVFDKATLAYMRPWVALSTGQAIRIFEDEVQNPQSELARHPEDYSLFKVGTFNDATGEIAGCEPMCLRRAHEVPQKPTPLQQLGAALPNGSETH